MRTLIEITCQFCGNKKFVPKSDVDRGKYKFCSNTCRGKATLLAKRGTASRVKICPVCNKEFIAEKKDRQTCSVECQAIAHSQWVKENQSGENNAFFGKKHTLTTRKKMSKTKKKLFANGTLVPYLKGKGKGRTYIRSKDLEWRLLRDLVVKRDNFKCILCGSSERLEVHHIIPYRYCLKNQIFNLVTLCRECNKKTYGKEDKFEGLLRSIIGGYFEQ